MTAAPRTLRERIRRRGARTALPRAVARAFRIPLLLVATALLRRRTRSIRSIEETVALAYEFSFCGISIRPWQEKSEILSLLRSIEASKPATLLEIGTSNGGSLFLFARAAAPDALLVSVDLPRGEFGGGYPRWRSILYRSFAKPSQRIRLLRADSHASQTKNSARAALEGRSVDFLFIDGDHTYEGVKQDFEMYGPLVRPGGLIAFHDIVPARPGGPRPLHEDDLQGGAVPEFWAEIRNTHNVSEYVEDWGSGRFGIGAVRVSSPQATTALTRGGG